MLDCWIVGLFDVGCSMLGVGPTHPQKSTFDPQRQSIYFPAVESSNATANLPDVEHAASSSLPARYLDSIGRSIIGFIQTARGLIAFTLITLGVAMTKFNASAR